MTGSYKVLILPSAIKEIRDVPRKDRKRIAAKIALLAAQPRSAGAEKLSGDDRYRLRQGDWRVVYGIDDAKKEVTVVKIGHRREVYR